jgi:hypothetical protein
MQKHHNVHCGLLVLIDNADLQIQIKSLLDNHIIITIDHVIPIITYIFTQCHFLIGSLFHTHSALISRDFHLTFLIGPRVLTTRVITNDWPSSNLYSVIPKINVKCGLNRSINVAFIQVLTHRNGFGPLGWYKKITPINHTQWYSEA